MTRKDAKLAERERLPVFFNGNPRRRGVIVRLLGADAPPSRSECLARVAWDDGDVTNHIVDHLAI